MSRIRGQGSVVEKKLGSALWKAGLRYRKQYSVAGKPDFAFPKAKVAVFCDSHFWHGYRWEQQGKAEFRKNREFWIPKIERNIQRDREVNEALKAIGWTVLRFWEHEIREDPSKCVEKVIESLTKASQ